MVNQCHCWTHFYQPTSVCRELYNSSFGDCLLKLSGLMRGRSFTSQEYTTWSAQCAHTKLAANRSQPLRAGKDHGSSWWSSAGRRIGCCTLNPVEESQLLNIQQDKKLWSYTRWKHAEQACAGALSDLVLKNFKPSTHIAVSSLAFFLAKKFQTIFKAYSFYFSFSIATWLCQVGHIRAEQRNTAGQLPALQTDFQSFRQVWSSSGQDGSSAAHIIRNVVAAVNTSNWQRSMPPIWCSSSTALPAHMSTAIWYS